MVQDVKFVFNWHARRFDIADGTDDITILHVAAAVVVPTDHENPGMPSAGGLDEEMKHTEIVVVSR